MLLKIVRLAYTSNMTILASYQARVAAGELQADAQQERAAQALDQLAGQMARYKPGTANWLQKLWGNASPAPKGLYLWGPVGRGKTMLMDSFFTSVSFSPKQRTHFHPFMLGVHGRIHAWRQTNSGDPLPAVAREIATQAMLLCFDEFQVTDVADAMILSRLFSALFELGVVVVATSNTPPERLYEHGLQRPLFLPFIEVLKQHCGVLTVAGDHDYRRLRLKGAPTYHTPENPAAVEQAFSDLTDGAAGEREEVDVNGRTLVVPRAAHSVAWFTFQELCEQPLGSADYLALAERYSTFIISGIPAIHHEQRDVARRFITLIDVLYDKRCKLIASAAVAPEWIYAGGQHVGEFARTVSRLTEMQSAQYWDA